METIWFMIVAFMITAYVVLDGFDLGAGIAHFYVGKNTKERGGILQAIGPVWDGNEVWLLAAGGTLYFAFPVLYSAAFSGFYLPLMIVLWLLIFRGIGIELRHQLESSDVGELLGFYLRSCQCLARNIFRCGTWKCYWRCSAERRRLFL